MPNSVTACCAPAFQGWKYGWAPPGTSPTLMLERSATAAVVAPELPADELAALVLHPAKMTAVDRNATGTNNVGRLLNFIIDNPFHVSYRVSTPCCPWVRAVVKD